MKALIRSASASALCAAALCCSAIASAQGAQTVVVQPGQQPAQAPPAQQPPVVVSPAPQPAQPSPVVVNDGSSAVAASAETPRPFTRPNRTLLMTGLVVAGAPYIASVGIAATSPHAGDANLWIPALGPWLDLGDRGGCEGDCGTENGNRVLLVADGILQTVGVMEIIGAFVFPETYTTTVTTVGGAQLSLTPSKVGKTGYGVSAVGQF